MGGEDVGGCQSEARVEFAVNVRQGASVQNGFDFRYQRDQMVEREKLTTKSDFQRSFCQAAETLIHRILLAMGRGV